MCITDDFDIVFRFQKNCLLPSNVKFGQCGIVGNVGVVFAFSRDLKKKKKICRRTKRRITDLRILGLLGKVCTNFVCTIGIGGGVLGQKSSHVLFEWALRTILQTIKLLLKTNNEPSFVFFQGPGPRWFRLWTTDC